MVIKMNKKFKVFNEFIIIGLFGALSATTYIMFIINNKFAPSGINGIATMVQYKLGISIGFISLFINIPLCILAYIFLNKQFALKSFTYTLCYSLVYLVLQNTHILDNFAYNANGTDIIIPVLTAALISGYIYGNVFRINASTGGTDIIAKLISKRKPEFNFFYVIFVLNAIVAISSYFVYGQIDPSTNKIIFDLKPVLLSIGYSYVSSKIGNSMLEGIKKAVKFEVITDEPEKLAQEIIDELHHSVTMKTVTGMYSHSTHKQLTCIVNKHQIVDFKRILEKYPNSFAYVTPIHEMIGNFKKIKN